MPEIQPASEAPMTYPQDALDHLSTLRDYVRWGASRFKQAGLFFGHGTANAIDEAAALALHALYLPHNLPGGYFNCVLTPDERLEVVSLLERRIAERKPAAYLTHEAWFCGLPFYVDERVLVPRSPIAELIEKQFSPWVGQPDEITDILDLCTGSGCIAIACALAFPGADVDAADISPDALDVAKTNIIKHEAGQVQAVQSDLFEALGGNRYDLIVSNPPYVSSDEWRNLPAEYHAEPKLGLESGTSGLDCVRRILREAETYLKPNGLLIVEVGSSADALEEAYPGAARFVGSISSAAATACSCSRRSNWPNTAANSPKMKDSSKGFALIGLFLSGLMASAISPKDYFTWILEVFPALVAFAVLLGTYGWFRFTDLTYGFVLLNCYIMFIGGHYTYAEVPLFNWIRDVLGQERNNFDKVGHFAQGFVPALFVRELLVRNQVVAIKAWLPGLVVCVCMTVSVLYEFLEWFVAVTTGEAADAFLGTQGDVWDTQWDMLFALIGATTSMLTMAGWQDRQIEGPVNAEKNQRSHP